MKKTDIVKSVESEPPMKKGGQDSANLTWDFEQSLTDGATVVAGVDEVGRGCLAGPVYAAAVVLPSTDSQWEGLNDSKQLSKKRREQLSGFILEKAFGVGIGTASVAEIDYLNILHAARLAMARAVTNLRAELSTNIDLLLVDGTYEPLWEGNPLAPTITVVQGDGRCPSIAAASIIAKVSRDESMATLAESYPGYGFERNAGYGTKQHLQALDCLGITPYHRKSFAPVAKHLQLGLDLYG